MDIISHSLSGVAAGTVVATVSNCSWKRKGLIIMAGGFGGFLPDFDAISLWSKFDSTIGAFLNLEHKGKEIYFGKFWYSHHSALHSIVAPILLILLSVFLRSIRKKSFNTSQIIEQVKNRKYSFLAFFVGFLFHLLEDMPTPACVWGGVNFFFPSSNYVGGYGKIWWWNNYDLVLIIVGVILLNLLVNVVPKRFYRVKLKTSVSVLVIGIVLFLIQMNTRPVDFAYTGHTVNYQKMEQSSKQIQKEILGDRLFQFMMYLDNKIPLNF